MAAGVTINFGHSELFPYAIRLAQEWGADNIYVEPTVEGGKRHVPDVFGVRKSPEGTRCLIVECEWSTDEKLKRGGIKEGFAQDAALMDMAEVVFLLNGPALHQKKRLREFFGENVPM